MLVDDDAVAAHAASIQTLNWFQLLHPRTWKATRQASRRGHHVHKPGKRVKQIGATFVIGAGDRVRYEHMDADSTDHADIDELVSRGAQRLTSSVTRDAARSTCKVRSVSATSGPARRGSAGVACASHHQCAGVVHLGEVAVCRAPGRCSPRSDSPPGTCWDR